MGEISFRESREDFYTISEIAHRAKATWPTLGWTVLDFQMDITAVHANGRPLRLAELAAADDFNFAHDVLGIREHLNRETGQLENCFLPRFSKPEAA